MAMDKEYYEKKRLLAFTSVNTTNTEWVHATVKDFVYQERYDKKGELIEEWIPVYDIPTGYTNPFEADVLSSKTLKCQLCDHPIIYKGIILHKEKMFFLVVGTDCYELYETDNDKKLKFELLCKKQSEWWENKISLERDKIMALINAKKTTDVRFYKSIIPEEACYYYKAFKGYSCYKAYVTIAKNMWMTYSPIKFKNFLAKHSYFFNALGYEPPKIFGAKFYKEYLRNIVYVRGFLNGQKFFGSIYQREHEGKDYYRCVLPSWEMRRIVKNSGEDALAILFETIKGVSSKKIGLGEVKKYFETEFKYGEEMEFTYKK